MRSLIAAILFCTQGAVFAQTVFRPGERQRESVWVDSIYNRMTLEERLGQLFMVAAYSNKDAAHENAIENLVRHQKIGGLIFFQGGPMRQARLTNRYQAASKLPLFIGIDAEWGLSMRLDSVSRYPWNMTLGAIRDLSLIEKVGEFYGKQSKRIGVHFNFAPVVDINTNPRNPIIGNRSFGESREGVTQHALALMRGVQREGVFATGKHFPGHGDTEVDSHYALPLVNFSRERLHQIELYPYKKLFDEGLASVMVAHLNVPALESRPGYPSSISHNVVTDLLQHQMGFKGLIFTDALNMKGASNFKQPGEIDLEAFLAGNDILLFAEDVPLALDKLCGAYQDSLISDERIAQSVKKILRFKFQAGLDRYQPVDMNNLVADLNPAAGAALQYELYANAQTLVINQDDLPIQDLASARIAYVKMGEDNHFPFLNTLSQYTEISVVDEPSLDSLAARLKPFSKIIVGFHKSDGAWRNHDFTDADRTKLDTILKHPNVTLVSFTKPYALLGLPQPERFKSVLLAYQNSEVSQIVAAQMVFGGLGAKGKLPVSLTEFYPAGHGLETLPLHRLGFTAPENVGMDSRILNRIDDLARKGISEKLAPGMQILVARKGKVVYHKAFGHHTYEQFTPVQTSDLYDIASLTKIVGTLPHLMQLVDAGTLKPDTKLGRMLPLLAKTDKRNITLKDVLSHRGRLQAWVPFYQQTIGPDKKPLERYYAQTMSAQFSGQVARNLYIRNDYRDTILKQIAKSKLLPKNTYKYSDLGFILFKEYLQQQSGESLADMGRKAFFEPMGMNRTLYNPLEKFDQSQIPPTEIDDYFRHQEIQGFVHDMQAAMEGGIGGQAGLFSNAMDLAKFMQMYLQKGHYGNRRYFSPQTFDLFNDCHFCDEGNRRGLGLDKPQLPNQAGPTCNCVSMKSFGHTGFTGTMAWADPDTETVYIFLSNRTYPNATENRLSKSNLREDIQRLIQQSITD